MAGDRKDKHLAQLRQIAEAALEKLHSVGLATPGIDADAAFQELQVHQIELELQNEELFAANQETELQRLKFEGIYDLAPVGYFILDQHGVIEEVNAAGISLLGAGKAYLRGRLLQTFFEPTATGEFHNFFRRIIGSKQKERCQLRLVSRGGEAFYALLEGYYVRSSAKCYLAMIDVSEAIESRMRLAETAERLELALQAAAAGTWELRYPTMQFHLDATSSRICQAVGQSAYGYEDFLKLIHPDDRFAADQHFRSGVNNHGQIDTVCRFGDPGGNTCLVSIHGHSVTAGLTDPEKRFVGIITDITEKRKLEEKAEQDKRQRQKEIAAATVQAEEKERRRISEALHDSVSQLLYGVKLHVNQRNAADDPAHKEKLNQLLDMAIRETRNISFELAPPILADFGLPDTINELCDRLSVPALELSATFSGFGQRLDLLLEITIFRIIQELVNNCIKHSGASKLYIQLKKNKSIEIIVTDNGTGFSPAQPAGKAHGAGLASIRNRIALYQGTLNLQTAPGEGTTVIVKLELAYEQH